MGGTPFGSPESGGCAVECPDVSVLAHSALVDFGCPFVTHRPRILIVTNVGWFFLSHRLPIALAARDRGFDVHVASGIEDASEAARIRDLGFAFHQLSITRSGMRVLAEIRVIGELTTLYRSLRPALVHHVSLKAVLYG